MRVAMFVLGSLKSVLNLRRNDQGNQHAACTYLSSSIPSDLVTSVAMAVLTCGSARKERHARQCLEICRTGARNGSIHVPVMFCAVTRNSAAVTRQRGRASVVSLVALDGRAHAPFWLLKMSVMNCKYADGLSWRTAMPAHAAKKALWW